MRPITSVKCARSSGTCYSPRTLKGNEIITVKNTDEAEMALAQCEVIKLGMTKHVFYLVSLYITAGVKGQTGTVVVKALGKCQATLLHINHL